MRIFSSFTVVDIYVVYVVVAHITLKEGFLFALKLISLESAFCVANKYIKDIMSE